MSSVSSGRSLRCPKCWRGWWCIGWATLSCSDPEPSASYAPQVASATITTGGPNAATTGDSSGSAATNSSVATTAAPTATGTLNAGTASTTTTLGGGTTSGSPSSAGGTGFASGSSQSVSSAASVTASNTDSSSVMGSGGSGATLDTSAASTDTTSNATTGGANAPCAGADLLCETFESVDDGAIPPGWSYNWGANATSISVQSSDSFSGARALRVVAATPSSGANQIMVDAGAFGAAHFGRLYYKVEQVGTMQSPGVAHSTLVSFWDGSSEFRVVDTVMNQQLAHQFLYNIQPSGDAEWGCGSPYDYSYSAAWQCVEWYFSSSEQTYRFFNDGTEVSSIGVQSGLTNGCGSPNRPIPTDVGQLNLGIYTYQAVSQGFVVWFDDLAIGSERVGCSAD